MTGATGVHIADNRMVNSVHSILKRALGFSLIELITVIAVVAVLTALAVPSYRGYVLRTNRMEAINALLEVAACQERIYVRFNQYDTTLCDASATTPNGLYVLGMNTTNSNQNYTLTATAQGGQVNDSCVNLSLTDQGIRGTSASNVAATVANCWKGKKI